MVIQLPDWVCRTEFKTIATLPTTLSPFTPFTIMNTATERETEQEIESGKRGHLLADDNNCTVSPDVSVEEPDDGTDQGFYCLITGANRYKPSLFLFFPFSPSICLIEVHSPTQRPRPCSLFPVPGALPTYSPSYTPSHFNIHHPKLTKVATDDRQHSCLPPPALLPRPNRAVYSHAGFCGPDRSTLCLRTDC